MGIFFTSQRYDHYPMGPAAICRPLAVPIASVATFNTAIISAIRKFTHFKTDTFWKIT